ncbi:hypothetical protein DFH07DRAFT_697730, partial [Mycena maculata]
PFAVRVAFSPLFAVEDRLGSRRRTVLRLPRAGEMECACGKVRYCSKECHKKDWKAHKPKCK